MPAKWVWVRAWSSWEALPLSQALQNVLDTDYNEISGLYACGNVMGGRFLGDYPVVLAGTSHGTCLCYGRLAGYQAAANAKGVRA